jgi:PLP dependent protein
MAGDLHSHHLRPALKKSTNDQLIAHVKFAEYRIHKLSQRYARRLMGFDFKAGRLLAVPVVKQFLAAHFTTASAALLMLAAAAITGGQPITLGRSTIRHHTLSSGRAGHGLPRARGWHRRLAALVYAAARIERAGAADGSVGLTPNPEPASGMAPARFTPIARRPAKAMGRGGARQRFRRGGQLVKNAIGERLQGIRARLLAATRKAGRAPGSVRLVAVSKTVDAAGVAAAYAAGQRCFGENRMQELEEKCQVLPDDVEWHMIGHLQRNKAHQAVACCRLIHSVDSLRLLRRLEYCAGQAGKVQPVLLQANISGEDAKSGLPLAALQDLAAACAELRHVRCDGFMTMAPYGAEEAELRRIFGALRHFAEQSRGRCQQPFPELSMGMSADFEIAVAEGATLVRIGSSIFGQRD